MAKKATKKASSFLTKYGKWILLALAAVMFIMLALVGVTHPVKDSDPITYTLAEVIFGKELIGDTGISGLAEGKSNIYFSIGGFIALILPLLVSAVSFFIKNKKIAGAVLFVGFAASAILFFLIPQMSGITGELTVMGKTSTTTSTFAENEFGLGLGSIFSAVIAILGALVSLGYTVSK